MSRRRKRQNKSLIDLALNEDWKFSLIASGIIFIIAGSIPPLFQGTVLSITALLLQKLAYLLGFLFLGISVVKGVALLLEVKKSNSNYGSINRRQELRTQLSEEINLEPRTQSPFDSFVESREWSLKLIQELEWKLFEDLCVCIFRTQGFNAVATALGGDGGIDIKLYKAATDIPTAIVQCKSWTQKVGVKPIREFIGVMKHERATMGFYVTTSNFTNEADTIAKQNGVTLLNGSTVLKMIQALNQDAQKNLYNKIVKGDYKTPTCPSCGIKMLRRNSTKGEFWGCLQYPKCRQTLKLRSVDTKKHRIIGNTELCQFCWKIILTTQLPFKSEMVSQLDAMLQFSLLLHLRSF